MICLFLPKLLQITVLKINLLYFVMIKIEVWVGLGKKLWLWETSRFGFKLLHKEWGTYSVMITITNMWLRLGTDSGHGSGKIVGNPVFTSNLVLTQPFTIPPLYIHRHGCHSQKNISSFAPDRVTTAGGLWRVNVNICSGSLWGVSKSYT